MDYFEEDKADKLKRLVGLRIMNAIGMVSWHKDSYGCAYQKLRVLHPISWFWIVGIILTAVILQGVPETIRDLKAAWHGDCVWW
jgi:hypothetical protein